jgi:uncharacterized protein involved in cysteine biosynthesis
MRDLWLSPALWAIEQLGDRVFLGVVARSVAATVLLFAGLAVLVQHGVHAWLGLNTWLAGLLGGAGALLLAWLLFLPVAGLVASLFADRVAAAVERLHYPGLVPARAAPLGEFGWEGLVLAGQLLALQVFAWVAAPLFGISLPVGYAVAAWAIGRGLFVAVAMRRMPRARALVLYRQARPAVLFQGALATLASLVPVLNLLVPVLAVAALTHVLHQRTEGRRRVVSAERGVLGPPARRV